MPAVLDLAALLQVPVRKQQRHGVLRRLDPRRVDGQHVRPVGEEGDPSEAFRLALRRVDAGGLVEAHQLRVLRRRHLRHERQGEGIPARQVGNRQRRGVLHVEVALQDDAVDVDPLQRHLVAVEHQRRVRRHPRPPPERQRRHHFRALRVEAEREVDAIQDEVRRAVVGEMVDVAGVGAHICTCRPRERFSSNLSSRRQAPCKPASRKHFPSRRSNICDDSPGHRPSVRQPNARRIAPAPISLRRLRRHLSREGGRSEGGATLAGPIRRLVQSLDNAMCLKRQ